MKKRIIKTFTIVFLSIFFISPLASEVIVDVRIPMDTTLKVISQKYLNNPDDISKLKTYNKVLPDDENTSLKTDVIKIPLNLLKAKVGDLAFVSPLTLTKNSKELIWQKTKKGQRFFPGDGIMTADGGCAKISFLAGGELTVSPDSLIFLKETQERPLTNFLAGNLSVEDIKIVSRGVEIKPEKNSKYNINTSAEKDVRLSVHEGSVNVTAKKKTVTVKEGFKTEVKFGEEPALPSPLPESVNDFNKLRELKDGEKYHVQISFDEHFKNIVSDKYLKTRNEVTVLRTELSPGAYYLRISLFTEDGFESKWSDFYYFVKGPESKNKLIIGSIEKISPAGDEIQVTGIYPGATGVFINGHPGEIHKDGKFICKFKIGDNEMFSIFIQSDSGLFTKRFKKGSGDLWLPIGE